MAAGEQQTDLLKPHLQALHDMPNVSGFDIHFSGTAASAWSSLDCHQFEVVSGHSVSGAPQQQCKNNPKVQAMLKV